MSRREFEVVWDGSVRGRGAATKGVPQGSALSLVLFLVFMAPILEEMERRVKEKVGRVDVQFPSYVDDLLLPEVKTCIALKNYSEARYLGLVICTFPFNNFYPIWSLSMTLASCIFSARLLHAYIS